MNEARDKAFVRESVDTALCGVREDPFLAQRILNGEKEERIVKKKLSMGAALLIAALLLTTAGLAVVRGYGILDYTPHQSQNEAYTQKILPLNQVWEGEFFSAVIHEAVFDGVKMTFTMSITPREGADPVYVIPYIRASLNGQPLELWSMGGKGAFSADGFWVPDIMPDFDCDYTDWAVDMALSDEFRTCISAEETVLWEIDFHVLRTDWPIAFTEEDEPMIGEEAWTDAEYAVYEQQFEDAYRRRQLLLNRAGMFWLSALEPRVDEWCESGMDWTEIVEKVLTKEAFTLAETASFRFETQGAAVKTSREPVAFLLPDGYRVEVAALEAAVDQIGMTLRITREDGQPAVYSDFPWDFAVLADGAQTAFGASSMGSREDGSIRYEARISVNGEASRLMLVPVDAGARITYPPDENGNVSSSSMQQAVMKNGAPLTDEQQRMMIVMELE